MSKLNESLDDFTKENGWFTSGGGRLEVYDENGKQVKDYHIPSDNSKYEFNNVTTGEAHIITTDNEKGTRTRIPESGSYTNQGDGFSDWKGRQPGYTVIPNADDLEKLTAKNENGEYLVRSMSVASHNGTRMSVVRNNKFSSDDEANFKQVNKELTKATQDYDFDFQETYSKNFEKAKSEISKDDFPMTIDGKDVAYYPQVVNSIAMDKARRETIKEIGTFEQNVLENQGFYDKYEQCNVKFRVSRKNTEQFSPLSYWDNDNWTRNNLRLQGN